MESSLQDPSARRWLRQPAPSRPSQGHRGMANIPPTKHGDFGDDSGLFKHGLNHSKLKFLVEFLVRQVHLLSLNYLTCMSTSSLFCRTYPTFAHLGGWVNHQYKFALVFSNRWQYVFGLALSLAKELPKYRTHSDIFPTIRSLAMAQN